MSRSNWLAVSSILADAQEIFQTNRDRIAQVLMHMVSRDADPADDPEREAEEVRQQFLLLRCFDQAVKTLWDLTRVCASTAEEGFPDKLPAGLLERAAALSDLIADEKPNEALFQCVSDLRQRFYPLFKGRIEAIEAAHPTIPQEDYYEEALRAADEAQPDGADYADENRVEDEDEAEAKAVAELRNELDEMERE